MNYNMQGMTKTIPALFAMLKSAKVEIKKKHQPDKLEPKSEKCVFIGYPKETAGYTFYHRSERNKRLFLESGPFSRKSFSRKNWVGGWWRLDEVIEPSLQLVCSRAQEVVPVAPTPIEVEAYDGDHETSYQVTTKPRGMTRMRTTSEWYVILSWKSCC